MKTLEIVLAVVFIVVIYLTGYLRGMDVQRKQEPIDPNACRFGQEETGGLFIGRRFCHTHGQIDDTGADRCAKGLASDEQVKLPLLAPGQPVVFEQGEFVVLEMTSDYEDGYELRLSSGGDVLETPVGSKVRTHVRLVDRESRDRDTKIVGYEAPPPPATDWNVPGA